MRQPRGAIQSCVVENMTKEKKKRSYDTHLGQQVTTVSVTEPAMFILLQADVYPRGQMPGE